METVTAPEEKTSRRLERLDRLERQHKLLTEALRHILEARFTGDMPHASAEVVALMGGEDEAARAGFRPRIDARFAQIETQCEILTNTLRYLLEKRWTGEMPHAAAEVVSLLGGDEEAARLGFKPVAWPASPIRSALIRALPHRTRGMLDCQNAPSLEAAVAAAQEIGAEAWCVYIGGPYYAGDGWTPKFVRQLADKGLTFLPTYVGQQLSRKRDWRGSMTADQGTRDGEEAAQLMAQFGWDAGAPVCLDVERDTYDLNAGGTITYVGAWTAAVKSAGYRPGVYSNPEPVAGMDGLSGDSRPDFVWVASWVGQSVDSSLNTRQIPGFADHVWSTERCRAWQYAGEVGGRLCQVRGMDVDISVTDVVIGEPG